MYKEITLKLTNGEERPFKFLASSSTAYRYKEVFQEDLMIKLTKLEQERDLTIGDKLAYIMNAQAEGKPMKKLNYDLFLDWLDQLESSELIIHMEEIINLYLGSRLTSSMPKKE